MTKAWMKEDTLKSEVPCFICTDGFTSRPEVRRRTLLEAIEAYYSTRSLRFRLKVTGVLISIVAATFFGVAVGLHSIAVAAVWLLVAFAFMPVSLSAIEPGHQRGLLPLAVTSILLACYSIVVVIIYAAKYKLYIYDESDCPNPNGAISNSDSASSSSTTYAVVPSTPLPEEMKVIKLPCESYHLLHLVSFFAGTLGAVFFSLHSYFAYDLHLWTSEPPVVRTVPHRFSAEFPDQTQSPTETAATTIPIKQPTARRDSSLRTDASFSTSPDLEVS